MSILLANARRAAVAAVLVLTALVLRREWRQSERAAVLCVESADAAAVCADGRCRTGVFFERLRALGVSGVVLRPEPLDRLVAAKKVLRFSAEELSRMRAAGLAAADAPLAPGALFVKEDAVRRRLEAAALAQDAALKAGRWGGQSVLELPPGTAAEGFSAGYDPDVARSGAEAGLGPVYRAATTADLRLALDADGAAAVLLDPPSSSFSEESRAALGDALEGRRLWAAAPPAAPWARGASRFLAAAELPSSASLPLMLSLAEGAGPSLVVVRLDAAAGPERAVADLRRLARGLRARGVGTAWPVGADERRRPGRAESLARAGAAFAACVLGAVWAMRRGVSAARAVSGAAWLAEAAPVREALSGSAAAFLAAVGAGAAAHAAAYEGGAGAGLPAWSGAGAALVAAAGFAGLWLAEDKDWRRLAQRERALWSAAASCAFGAWFVCAPPSFLARAGFGLAALTALEPGLWWLPARWAEVLVGWPALFTGLCLLAEERAEARPWLYAGLAAPFGTAMWLARARVPFTAGLAQSAGAAGFGLLLGAALWAAYSSRRR